jgi:hypothetical protein
MTFVKPLRIATIAAVCAAASLAASASAIAKTPSTSGMFVIGDQSATVGTQVTFWGAQWWKDNGLSGGAAPASFKGFADNATGYCGDTWSTRPGNSSAPPAADSVTGQIPVIVSTAVSKSGPVISGDISTVVLVQVDPGYEPDPGHPGTGTVVGVVCGGDVFNS